MLPLLIAILISSLNFSTFAFPQTSLSLYRRNDNSSSKISTTILSPNGTDITSSFRTMVYYPPKVVAPDPTPTSPDKSSTLNPRGTLTYSYLGRPIGGDGMCRSPTAEFQHSVCKRTLGLTSRVQDFLVYCQESPSPQPSTANRGGPAGTSYQRHDPPVLAEEGSCWDDEICIDGIFADQGYPALASCVLEEDYNHNEDEDIEEELEGRGAQITVTALDGRAPMRMRNLEIEAARRGNRYGGSGRLETIRECGDCFQLKTKALAAGTTHLKMEATAMTAGAMAGILWVTVLSG